MLKRFLRFRSYVVLVIAIAVAYFTIQGATQTIQVVVAAEDLGENTVLTTELLKVVSFPAGAKLSGMVEADQQGEIVGMITRTFIPAGHPITRPYLQPPSGGDLDGFGLTSAIVDPRNVLFPLPAPPERVALAGKILPGEYVDVYLVWEDPTVQQTGQGARDKATLYLQHQKVFGYDGNQVTLEVPKVAAAVLAYAGKIGEVIIAPSRVDEVLMPDGEVTVDSSAFGSLFGKPISGTVNLRDLYGRDDKSLSDVPNPTETREPVDGKAKP